MEYVVKLHIMASCSDTIELASHVGLLKRLVNAVNYCLYVPKIMMIQHVCIGGNEDSRYIL